jgi:hypothetical protein
MGCKEGVGKEEVEKDSIFYDAHRNIGKNQPLYYYFGCKGEVTTRAQLERDYNAGAKDFSCFTLE